MYIGVNGVARKIKKAYIGVNGVARLFYSTSILTPLGKEIYEPIDPGALEVSASQNPSYAFFAGSGGTKKVNSSLTITSATALYKYTSSAGPAHIGNYAYFMSGVDNTSNANDVDYYTKYDTSGTRTYGSLTPGRNSFWSTNGNWTGQLTDTFAFCAGGFDSSASTPAVRYLDYFNISGTASYTTLANAVTNPGVADNGTIALIIGGDNAKGTYYSTANTFNKSGTRGTTTSYPISCCYSAGARAGNLAIISGGQNSTYEEGYGYTGTVAYNTSGTRQTLANLNCGRNGHSGISLGKNYDYVLFGGATEGPEPKYWYPDLYDSKGVKIKDYGRGSGPYEHWKMATIGKWLLVYAMDCRYSSGWQGYIDAYEISTV